LNVAADNVGLVLRWLAVRPHRDPVAEHAGPFRHIRRQVLRISRERRTAGERGAGTGDSRQETAACRPFRRFLIHGFPYHETGGTFYKPRKLRNNFPGNCRGAQ
jgi:hypothetical protein